MYKTSIVDVIGKWNALLPKNTSISPWPINEVHDCEKYCVPHIGDLNSESMRHDNLFRLNMIISPNC